MGYIALRLGSQYSYIIWIPLMPHEHADPNPRHYPISIVCNNLTTTLYMHHTFILLVKTVKFNYQCHIYYEEPVHYKPDLSKLVISHTHSEFSKLHTPSTCFLTSHSFVHSCCSCRIFIINDNNNNLDLQLDC